MFSGNAGVEMVISNGISDCHAVHDIAICGNDLIFFYGEIVGDTCELKLTRQWTSPGGL